MLLVTSTISISSSNNNSTQATKTSIDHQANFSSLPSQSRIKNICVEALSTKDSAMHYNCYKLSIMFFCAREERRALSTDQKHALELYCNHIDNKTEFNNNNFWGIEYHTKQITDAYKLSKKDSLQELRYAKEVALP